jgi:hypothetical protein
MSISPSLSGAAASQSQLLSRRMQRQPANPFLELLPLMTDAENSVLCKGAARHHLGRFQENRV